MRPFDIERAKAGEPVCTREGLKARIICYDRTGDEFNVVALVRVSDDHEAVGYYTTEGLMRSSGQECSGDLMMFEKKKGYLNIYEGAKTSSSLYKTKREAMESRDAKGYVTTIKIEWEE